MSDTDPLWGVPATIQPEGDGIRVDCPRSGGVYIVSGSALPTLSNLSARKKALLSTWIFEENRHGGASPPKLTTYSLESALSRRPFTTSERMDRMLLYLSSRDTRPGERLGWLGPHTQKPLTVLLRAKAMAWIEAYDEAELGGIVDLLSDAGLLRKSDGQVVTVSARGFERMEALRQGAIASDQAFVAMWFDGEMTSTYEEAIEPAIVATGFRPMRIDRKEHVNKIDDEIIAEIKRSRFVIADFTCRLVEVDGRTEPIPRGGVYYEAGFAQGLGIPVIWTVRANQFDFVHFDTRQFNHIGWTNAADLKVGLINRIRALFVDAP